ncbi:MAG: SulP family inorganic anion transporter, partial [Pseudomonadota bacterium]
VIAALAAIPAAVLSPNVPALIIGAVTLGVIFFWPAKFGKWVPEALAALMIGTLLSLALPGAPVLGDIPTGLPQFVLPSFTLEQSILLVMVKSAIILALLGAIDSLLTSLVADNMTRTRHNSDRELIGQGIGNSLAGLFGAIPGAGATMRTVVNIRTGGATKISGMLHSGILVAIVLALGPLASQIPHAVLAGILIKVGYDIIDITYLKRSHKGPRWDLALMAIVLGLTVFVDLIVAVGVGVTLAALAFVKRLADLQLASIGQTEAAPTTPEEETILDEAKGQITVFDFGGPLSFGAAADLGHQVRESVPEHTSAIILDFERLAFIDVSAARAVDTIASDAKAAGKTVYICGMNKDVAEVLSGLGIDNCLPLHTRYDTRLEAVRAADAEIHMVATAAE